LIFEVVFFIFFIFHLSDSAWFLRMSGKRNGDRLVGRKAHS